MLPLPLPLIRVLDLTTSVAGAAASRALADFGAEVIVVERPGATREAMQRFGRSKFSCAIDPSNDEGHDLLLRLAAGCHAVLKDADDVSLTGLDLEALRGVREDSVLAVIAEGGERPGIGNVAAGAVMTALFHVRFRGEGQQVTVGFNTASASMRSAPVVASAAGAAHLTPDLPPSGCYTCSDGSIALVVRSDEEADALRGLLESAQDENLGASFAAWAAGRTAQTAADALLRLGIAAQEVLAASDLPDDAHLRARGIFEAVAAGTEVTEMDGPRIRFSDTPLHTRWATPTLGEHTDYILRGLIGLSEAEIGSLKARGVVS